MPKYVYADRDPFLKKKKQKQMVKTFHALALSQAIVTLCFLLKTLAHTSKMSNNFRKPFWDDIRFKVFTLVLMTFRGMMISEGELWLTKRSTAHQGPWNHQFASIAKSYCLPIHPFPMYDPNKHGIAWSARWIWGSPPPLLCSLSRINSSSGEPERSVCQVLSPEKNRGKTK